MEHAPDLENLVRKLNVKIKCQNYFLIFRTTRSQGVYYHLQATVSREFKNVFVDVYNIYIWQFIKHVLTATWKYKPLPYWLHFILIRGLPCQGGITLSSGCLNVFNQLANEKVSNENKHVKTFIVNGSLQTVINVSSIYY